MILLIFIIACGTVWYIISSISYGVATSKLIDQRQEAFWEASHVDISDDATIYFHEMVMVIYGDCKKRKYDVRRDGNGQWFSRLQESFLKVAIEDQEDIKKNCHAFYSQKKHDAMLNREWEPFHTDYLGSIESKYQIYLRWL